MACRALIVPSMDLSFVVADNGVAGFNCAADGSESFVVAADGLTGFDRVTD